MTVYESARLRRCMRRLTAVSCLPNRIVCAVSTFKYGSSPILYRAVASSKVPSPDSKMFANYALKFGWPLILSQHPRSPFPVPWERH
jgi:hypothetical protein